MQKLYLVGWMCLACVSLLADAPVRFPEKGSVVFHSVPNAHFQFHGLVEKRIEANVQHWLLCAPEANPGMLEMFRVRDRKPVPELVPWAGEFAGKYLISAVQALRMAENPALRSRVESFVKELLSTQDTDGYLGPFPKSQRLLGNWDLWGHYHVMQGLLLWHELTGDPAALQSCRRAADLICRTYLDQPRRIFDAGSHEMNMAVIHGLGILYRRTAEPSYFRMMQEIEKDWERAGDYLRTGLNGTEFFASPRPRWESLHDLQGLVELWRITGETRYRDSFMHHWRSIVRWDRHNTGGFSSGEQATGNPYSPNAIETCCTIAWMALSIDMLHLSGDSRVADELELSTWNGALGAQHPSGRWWTYNTPMDGTREASAHTIVFQARAGTPELNCCSVNGPRALSMLSEWAVMADPRGLAVNWHGPGEFQIMLPDQTPVQLRCETDYPLDGHVKWTMQSGHESKPLLIRFRIPAWSSRTWAKLNGEELSGVQPGSYLECHRTWKQGDVLELDFDMALRALPGDRETLGKVSLYRGPLLLAYDQRLNPFDESDIPAVDLSRLAEARITKDPANSQPGRLAPWLQLELPVQGGRRLLLCDYASAGVTGTRYRSWLAATQPLPPPPVTRLPADGVILGPGKTSFRWTTRTNAFLSRYCLAISASTDFIKPIFERDRLTLPRMDIDESLKAQLRPDTWYYWRVTAFGPNGQTCSVEPSARFRFDPRQPPASLTPDLELGPERLAVRALLLGNPDPAFGRLDHAAAIRPADGPDGLSSHAVYLNNQMLVYALPEPFEEDYSVSLWVRIRSMPEKRLGQIFSSWAAPMDDPLRLTLDNSKLFARIEAQQGYSTKGLPIQVGTWSHLAAVKSGSTLTLFIDGSRADAVTVPRFMNSAARLCALGGNPRYSGNESLEADFAAFQLFLRALSEEEVLGFGKLGFIKTKK